MSAASGRVTGIDSLPESLVHQIFSILPASDLSSSAGVCKDWHKLAQDETLWFEVAERKWPQGTVNLRYYKTYQALVKDYNKEGASVIFPLEEGNTSGFWKDNSQDFRRYYECQVLQAEWLPAQGSEPSSPHRRDFLLVYVDARGEKDLREARSSKLAVIAWFPTCEGRLPEVQQLLETQYYYFVENKPGHQLACLLFRFDGDPSLPSPDAQLSFEFWYACPQNAYAIGHGPAPLSTYEFYSDYTRAPVIRRMGSHEFKQFIHRRIREGPFDGPYRREVCLGRESYDDRLARWRHVPDEKLFDGWFV